MKQELENDLVEKFPKLYKDIKGDPSKTRMCDGFCVGDGWYKLILDLSQEIDDLCKQLPDNEYPYLFQVKEKFGGLRYYIEYNDIKNDDIKNRVLKICEKYENKSYTICEVCGSDKGQPIMVRGWINTLCDEHKGTISAL